MTENYWCIHIKLSALLVRKDRFHSNHTKNASLWTEKRALPPLSLSLSSTAFLGYMHLFQLWHHKFWMKKYFIPKGIFVSALFSLNHIHDSSPATSRTSPNSSFQDLRNVTDYRYMTRKGELHPKLNFLPLFPNLHFLPQVISHFNTTKTPFHRILKGHGCGSDFHRRYPHPQMVNWVWGSTHTHIWLSGILCLFCAPHFLLKRVISQWKCMNAFCLFSQWFWSHFVKWPEL